MKYWLCRLHVLVLHYCILIIVVYMGLLEYISLLICVCVCVCVCVCEGVEGEGGDKERREWVRQAALCILVPFNVASSNWQTYNNIWLWFSVRGKLRTRRRSAEKRIRRRKKNWRQVMKNVLTCKVSDMTWIWRIVLCQLGCV